MRAGRRRIDSGNKESRAISALKSLLSDSDATVRNTAAQSLDLLGSPEAITELIVALADPAEMVHGAASTALNHIQPAWYETDISIF